MLKRFALLAFLVVISSTVLAQYDHQRKERSPSGSRDTRFEGSVILAFQNGLEESNEIGSAIDVDSTLGWGFSVGWNWTSKWNIAYRLHVTEPDYEATIIPDDEMLLPQTFDHKMSKYSHQLNVTYNFSEKAFTPFVQAGIGWTKLDSNIPGGPPDAICWWDPWWGYVCISDWKTYDTSDFSYNLGLGFRWDINNAVFTRGTYSREFLDLDNGTFDFDTLSLEMGLMF